MSALKRGRRTIVGTTLAGVLAVVGLALAAPSYAHETRVYHSDTSWIYVPHSPGGHGKIAVCDNDPDGHMVYARYELNNYPDTWKPHYRFTGYDSYGNDNEGLFCHWEGPGAYLGSPFRDIAVCVQYEGCSPWKRVGWGG